MRHVRTCICVKFHTLSVDVHVLLYYSARSLGRAGGPAGCGHSKLAHACTGLPLTSVQFISVTEVVTKSSMKKRNKNFFCEGL